MTAGRSLPGRPGAAAYEAVLMDLDGTLVFSEGVHRRAWQSFFDTWGVVVTDTDYEQHYMGRRPADVIAGVPGPWTGTDPVAAVNTMTDFTLEHAGGVQAVPGAAALIERLRVKYPVAVVTSAGRRWAEYLLEKVLQVRELIDVMITSEDITCGKPSPEGYLRACAALRALPGRSLAFEDSPSGVQALHSAGVQDIVGVTTTSTAAGLSRAGARWTVSDLTAEQLRGRAGPLSPAGAHGRKPLEERA
ncbi:HAD family hydrolase [Streptomyces xantholiticus]|uniref:HAD family phosphatase n=1 Tax=Streptomyces xantholiticus TaxID=68285 RepID=A0ABV1UMS7_9ACTN